MNRHVTLSLSFMATNEDAEGWADMARRGLFGVGA
jgi:hypothetical protein